MPQLLQGLISYINSWRGPFAIIAIMLGAIMWSTGHRFVSILEILAAVAILFSAQQLGGQLGFGG